MYCYQNINDKNIKYVYAIRAIYALGDYHTSILTENGWERVGEHDLQIICDEIFHPHGIHIDASPKIILTNPQLPEDWVHISDLFQSKIITRKKYFSNIKINKHLVFHSDQDECNCIGRYSNNLDVELKKFAQKSSALKNLYIDWINSINSENADNINIHINRLNTYLNIKYFDFEFLIRNIDSILQEEEIVGTQSIEILNILKKIQIFKSDQLKNINEIINYKIPELIIKESICHGNKNMDRLSKLTKECFCVWLKEKGYEEFTADGSPSTIYKYLTSIDNIIDLKNNTITWEYIINNIDTLLIEFNTYPSQRDALHKLKDYVTELNSKQS